MLFYELIIYIYFFNKKDANLITRDKLVDLINKRSEFKLIVNYIYKFRIFKLSSILFFYIY